MKHFNLLCRLTLLCIVCSFSLSAMSQGVAIYKKDGTMVKYSYEEIDSIVTYNYGDTPEVPDSIVTPPSAPQYEAVDLGLPSGLKWAAYNVGATAPEEYGCYYAWGETEEQSNYDWSTYIQCGGSNSTITKYCNKTSLGTVDDKALLDAEDDVAHVKWGGDWRMPTKEEQDELRDNCTWEWTTLNDVAGYRVTGPNGNSMFLPAAGYRVGKDISEKGKNGYYWSSSLFATLCYNAYALRFANTTNAWGSRLRYYGQPVRAVSK